MRTLRLSAIGACLALLIGFEVGVAAQEERPATRPAVPSDGCGLTTAEPGLRLGLSLEVDGLDRTWSMHVPPSHDGETPVPMWLQLHGCCGGSGAEQAMLHMAAADEHGFVFVAPDAHFADGWWMFDLKTTVLDTSASNPDIALTDALIDHLGSELCIDLARVYAAGYSAGGSGVSALGCVLEDRIAAVAPVAGMLDLGDDCQLDRPVPLLAIHAVNDGTAYFDGGYPPGWDDWPVHQAHAQASIPDRIANVAQRNGCGPEPTIEAIGEDVERWAWVCPDSTDVELLAHGGAHGWPRGDPVDASELIWDFFERHPMPAE